MKLKQILPLLMLGAAMPLMADLSGLRGEFRDGQLFLQWEEKNLAPDTRLSVWSSAEPITEKTLDKAEKIAGMLNINSAWDWWRHSESFVIKRSKKAKSEEIFAGAVADTDSKKSARKGFALKYGGKLLDPDSGLHVHTPNAKNSGKRYYAVTAHKGNTPEVLEMTSTTKVIEVSPGKAAPYQIAGKPMPKNFAAGRPLVIYLHGRGGGVGVNNRGRVLGTHIIFTDSNLAWREGIPFKFEVRDKGKFININLYDRVWTGRKLTRKESRDSRDHVPAISTFWLGYNSNIAVSNMGPEFKWDNYTERLILQIARWAQDYLGADKNRTYITGGSMGGSGTVQMVTHYPEFFAAGAAFVPVYSYSWKDNFHVKALTSIKRMQCSIGQFTAKNPARRPDGKTVEEYGNGAKNINRPAIDMPPLFATNGRNDTSIPWVNNPDFYRAANEARQAFWVFWNNGDHGMSRDLPKDMNFKESQLLRYSLDKSFPAFSNCSDNRNYGNGNPSDGDLTGWMNRGMDWQSIVDTEKRYDIVLTAAHPEMKYPVSCDVTLRRRQKFLPGPGDKITVNVNGKLSTVTLDENKLLTVKGVVFSDAKPVRMVLTY